MDYKKIVWIASYPKSGNTWFRLFLDAYFLGEVDPNDLVCSVSDNATARSQVGDGSEPWKFPIDIQQLTRPMALLRLVRQFNDNKFADIPLFVKSHNACMHANGIELIPACLTKAVIFITRDPRDVLPSYAKHMGKDLDKAVEMMGYKYQSLTANEAGMADFTSSWPMYTKSYVNNMEHNVLLVKYEDMRANPVPTFSRMLEHAGVEVDESKVRKALEIVDLGKMRAREKKEGFKESSPHAKNQFFGSGRVGGWRSKITPKQQHAIERMAGSLLKRLGYDRAKAA